jgi:hypothetical protein
MVKGRLWYTSTLEEIIYPGKYPQLKFCGKRVENEINTNLRKMVRSD